MRNDHKIALKKVKQQISAFCLRHGYRYDATVNQWTQAHLKWLRALKPEGLYRDILMEYLSTYDQLTDKIERMDRRIEELAGEPQYREGVKNYPVFLESRYRLRFLQWLRLEISNVFLLPSVLLLIWGLCPGSVPAVSPRTDWGSQRRETATSVPCW